VGNYCHSYHNFKVRVLLHAKKQFRGSVHRVYVCRRAHLSYQPPALTLYLHSGISYTATLEIFGEEFVMYMQRNDVATSVAGIFCREMEFNSNTKSGLRDIV